MTLEAALTTVLNALAEQLQTDADAIDRDTPLIEISGLDSVLLLRAVVMIEEELSLAIPDDVLYEVNTPAQLAKLVLDLA